MPQADPPIEATHPSQTTHEKIRQYLEVLSRLGCEVEWNVSEHNETENLYFANFLLVVAFAVSEILKQKDNPKYEASIEKGRAPSLPEEISQFPFSNDPIIQQGVQDYGTPMDSLARALSASGISVDLNLIPRKLLNIACAHLQFVAYEQTTKRIDEMRGEQNLSP